MATLVCWASGLLEIHAPNKTPEGPVVIATGSAQRLGVDMRTHGEFVEKYNAYYVPGSRHIPTEGREESAIQRDRMTRVIEWSKKLASVKAAAKKKPKKETT